MSTRSILGVARKKRSLSNDSIAEDIAQDDVNTAYSLGSAATWVKIPNTKNQCLTDYEPLMLSSFRVCYMRRGTIMESAVLIVEQMILFFIFFCCATTVYVCFNEEMATNGDGRGPNLRRFIANQESKMRAFAMIMTGLAAFLLSFYTSIIVTRWWTMRTGGVGAIKAATVDLELLLYQAVTQDESILSAVRRYGRTSLYLIFMWRRGETADNKELLQTMKDRELLNDHECEKLLGWGKHCMHETIWAWQMAIISKLFKEGRIKSDQLYNMLLQKCLDGRAAVQLVHTHLAVRVPMQYVHLLGLLVKMHNFVLAVIMGLLFGAACRNRQYILCCQLFARIFILPFLFNAILLINCDLADPFDGSEVDFPGEVYQSNLEKDCSAMVEATQNVPDWLKLKSMP